MNKDLIEAYKFMNGVRIVHTGIDCLLNLMADVLGNSEYQVRSQFKTRRRRQVFRSCSRQVQFLYMNKDIYTDSEVERKMSSCKRNTESGVSFKISWGLREH